VLLINTFKKKAPILTSEIFYQVNLTLIFSILIALNEKCEGFDFRFLFLSDLSIISIKQLYCIVGLLVVFLVYRAFILQNLNFVEFFFFF